MRIVILALLVLSSCASPRSSPIFALTFSDKPPRAAIRGVCNGQTFTTQGTVVCEQKEPTTAQISVKVPPLEGRVIYSNGQLKKTDDFNWYPAQGFWIFKNRPMKDTWADLDLGTIAATFGDWPVSLDIAADDPDVGVIVTRGVLYYRVCDDATVPCSKLETNYDCAGHVNATGPAMIGKCERLAGSPQDLTVFMKGQLYTVQPGAKLYVSIPRQNYESAVDITSADLASGQRDIELPAVLTGPTIVGLRMSWYQSGKIVSVETRILIIGYSPDWTGLDKPHYMLHNQTVDWVKPTFADVMEVDTFNGRDTAGRQYGKDKMRTEPKAGTTGPVCAFAWQRDSSDLSIQCLNYQNQEVSFP
ncbi:MAG: hypothetical protein P4M08_14315 [Oligoflexia bacterium]|nr:hypothetical protein [Oligoflexia bacterium]